MKDQDVNGTVGELGMGEPGCGVTEARGRVGFQVMRAANSSQRIRDKCFITTDEEPLYL